MGTHRGLLLLAREDINIPPFYHGRASRRAPAAVAAATKDSDGESTAEYDGCPALKQIFINKPTF